MRRYFTFLLSISFPFFAWASPEMSSAEASALPRVVASFSILGDLLKELSGEHAEVQVLVGPNQDAHVFEPHPSSLRLLAGADLVVSVGGHFESWLPRLLRNASFSGTHLVLLSKIEEERRISRDPHFWHDVSLIKSLIEPLSAELIGLIPSQREYLLERRDRLVAELAELDQWVREQIGEVPPEERRVLTNHDAFGYFARAYEVEFLSALGASTGQEASPRRLAQLADQIRSEQVRAVFIENVSNSRLVETLGADYGLSLGGTLYSDALSEPSGPAGTYSEMVRHNVRLLRQAWLGGDSTRN